MNDDAALLRRYAETGSNPAFTELVRRHVDLVYRAHTEDLLPHFATPQAGADWVEFIEATKAAADARAAK